MSRSSASSDEAHAAKGHFPTLALFVLALVFVCVWSVIVFALGGPGQMQKKVAAPAAPTGPGAEDDQFEELQTILEQIETLEVQINQNNENLGKIKEEAETQNLEMKQEEEKRQQAKIEHKRKLKSDALANGKAEGAPAPESNEFPFGFTCKFKKSGLEHGFYVYPDRTILQVGATVKIRRPSQPTHGKTGKVTVVTRGYFKCQGEGIGDTFEFPLDNAEVQEGSAPATGSTTSSVFTEFEITIKREAGNKWGMAGGSETDGTLLAMRIEEDGLIPKWNKDHPDRQVEKGDRVLSINGISGVEAIEKAMKEQIGNLKVKLKRKSKSGH